jgi:hypothetical protein
MQRRNFKRSLACACCRICVRLHRGGNIGGSAKVWPGRSCFSDGPAKQSTSRLLCFAGPLQQQHFPAHLTKTNMQIVPSSLVAHIGPHGEGVAQLSFPPPALPYACLSASGPRPVESRRGRRGANFAQVAGASQEAIATFRMPFLWQSCAAWGRSTACVPPRSLVLRRGAQN